MDKVLSLLGIASKARKILIGEILLDNFSKADLVLIASDASEKTKERILKKCHFYNCDSITEYDSDTLSHFIGKRNVKTIGICDKGFAEAMKKEIERRCDNGKTST